MQILPLRLHACVAAYDTPNEKGMMTLIENPVRVTEDHCLISFDARGLPPSRPGQFVNIRLSPSFDPLVRRPFSVFSHEGNLIRIVVKIVGRGTNALCSMKKGEALDVLGPLGRGFTIVENSRVLLVGGGVGNAPLFHLASSLKQRNNTITYIFGGRNARSIFMEGEYARLADSFLVATEDGSRGQRGLATEIARDLATGDGFDFIYTCGPVAMMGTLAQIASLKQSPLEVSMESYFGCGIGLCSGCTVVTREGNKRACVDGPVMDGRGIEWQFFIRA